MIFGFLLGVAACAIWGLIYIFPLLLPDYPPVVIASARFAVYGLTCLIFIPLQWRGLKELTFADWLTALRLAFFGSLVYYLCLVIGVQLAGAPITGMLMCWIPVFVAIVANREAIRKGEGLAWKTLALPLAMIMAGMVLANWTEFEYIVGERHGSPAAFWLGVASGVAALLLWTWFPLRNAGWLLANRDKSPKVWATAQGLSVLPFAVLGFWGASRHYFSPQTGLLGPEPVFFVAMMLVAGVCCCWMGAAFWNAMSQRLPTALAGQMIVFETIFSVLYALMWRQAWPTWSMVAGMVVMLSGVLVALRLFQKKSP